MHAANLQLVKNSGRSFERARLEAAPLQGSGRLFRGFSTTPLAVEESASSRLFSHFER